MSVIDATEKLNEILKMQISRVNQRKELGELFKSMKDNVKFYKKNKNLIDKVSTPQLRRKLEWEF